MIFVIFKAMQSIESAIRERSPLLKEDSAVFRALSRFFGEGAKIATDRRDLRDFLAPHRLYKVVKISENSWMKCAYALIERFPECLSALGMLRYYTSASEKVFWQDVEKAENIIAKALTPDSYGWEPDAFTVFADEENENFSLTVIVAL